MAFALLWMMQAMIGVEGELDTAARHRVVDFVRLQRDTTIERKQRELPDRKAPEEVPPPPSLDEITADAHPPGLFVRQGAGTDKVCPGVGGHEFNAKIFENVQGGFVDLLQRLGVDQLDPAKPISAGAGKGLAGADLGLAGLGGTG